jgi:DNA-binding transcriptional MerR regulator
VDGYRISQLAERAGVPATTLRFYESAGLLPAGRTASGYRIYGEDAIERLGFIGAAKRLGLSLEEIAELLEVWETGPCADVRDEMRERLVARISEAERRAAELAAFTAAVHRAVDHLDALPDRSERCGAECCPPSADQSDEQLRVGARRSALISGCPPSLDQSDQQPARTAEIERWRTAPVACSLSSLGERDERAAQWTALLVGASRTRISDGVRLTLPAERAARIAELAAAEQRCCPFFGFRLELDGPVLHFEVRAQSDGMDLLNALFS